MIKIMTITRLERFNDEMLLGLNCSFNVTNFNNDERIKIGKKIANLGLQDLKITDYECYISSILYVTIINGTTYIKYNVAVCVK